MKSSSVWHPGEIEAQTRAGSHERMRLVGERAISTSLPEQHRAFFSQLPLLMVAAEDRSGRLWATALAGKPGFILCPDPSTLQVESKLSDHDPLHGELTAGTDMGLLGIDLSNRRRNRVNAILTQISDQQLKFSVRQAFGNCPKYIQLRQRRENPQFGEFGASDFASIDNQLSGFLRRSDTCFIASLFHDGEPQMSRGVDISHRGGNPGFVTPIDEKTLLIPDYSGNNYFNTIGNLMRDERAALLFFNFSRGHLVHLSGRCEVVWSSDEKLPFEGVTRMLRFTLQQGRVVRNGLPFVYGPADYSPYNPLSC